LKKKYNPISKSNILSRATSSALAGLPIAYAVNILIFIPLVYAMDGYPMWIIGAIGSIPFFVTSLFRMYFIDWIWFKYKINIDPKHIIVSWWIKNHG